MHDRTQYLGTTPAASAAYRPKADANFLSSAVQTAWHDYSATMFPEAEKAAIAEAAAAHLERIYPADDMAVLARYGKLEIATSVSVRYYTDATSRWDRSVGFDLPRPVRVASGGSSLYQGGLSKPFDAEKLAAWARDYFKSDTPEKLAERVAETVEVERRKRETSFPAQWDHYFAKLGMVRDQYQAEYTVATGWPGTFKAEHGRYPTWAEIETAFPVLGAWIAARRATGAA